MSVEFRVLTARAGLIVICPTAMVDPRNPHEKHTLYRERAEFTNLFYEFKFMAVRENADPSEKEEGRKQRVDPAAKLVKNENIALRNNYTTLVSRDAISLTHNKHIHSSMAPAATLFQTCPRHTIF